MGWYLSALMASSIRFPNQSWRGCQLRRSGPITTNALCLPFLVHYPPHKEIEITLTKAAPKGRGKAGDPEGPPAWLDQTVTRSCRARATSTESPSWFRTSRPDSGTSPRRALRDHDLRPSTPGRSSARSWRAQVDHALVAFWLMRHECWRFARNEYTL